MSDLFVRVVPFAVVMLCAQLVACSWGGADEDGLVRDRRVEYKKARVADNALEVPPDLSASPMEEAMPIPGLDTGAAPGAAQPAASPAASPGASSGSFVLPHPASVRIERDGGRRWLVVQGGIDSVWEQVRSFWLNNGLLLSREDPRIGVMETEWLENRADIKSDPLRNLLKKTLLDNVYSTPTRDKFRVRLERGQEEGTTDVYVTHYGMVETAQRMGGEETLSVWQPRPSDPELEAEMLNRIMVYLGVEEQRSRQMLAKGNGGPSRATLIRDASGGVALQIDESFSEAWRMTGMAIDDAGLLAEDRDRSEGIYYVRYDDPFKTEKEKGLLSKLAFWRSDDKPSAERYLLKLEDNGSRTQLLILDVDRHKDRSTTAVRILTLLQEHMH